MYMLCLQWDVEGAVPYRLINLHFKLKFEVVMRIVRMPFPPVILYKKKTVAMQRFLIESYMESASQLLEII